MIIVLLNSLGDAHKQGGGRSSTSETPFDIAARKDSSFGGVYYDDDGTLTVLVSGNFVGVAPGSVLSLPPKKFSQVKQLISTTFGTESLDNLKTADSTTPTLRVRAAKYSWAQLTAWMTQLSEKPMPTAEMAMLGLYLRGDRMVIEMGIVNLNASTRAELQSLIHKLSIPQDAIVFLKMGIAKGL